MRESKYFFDFSTLSFSTIESKFLLVPIDIVMHEHILINLSLVKPLFSSLFLVKPLIDLSSNLPSSQRLSFLLIVPLSDHKLHLSCHLNFLLSHQSGVVLAVLQTFCLILELVQLLLSLVSE